ncbi:hypothetical protein ACJZTR_00310 [Neorickettsia risticii]
MKAVRTIADLDHSNQVGTHHLIETFLSTE